MSKAKKTPAKPDAFRGLARLWAKTAKAEGSSVMWGPGGTMYVFHPKAGKARKA